MPNFWHIDGSPGDTLAPSSWSQAELCPKTKLPTPSKWAQEAIHITANKIQRSVLDSPSQRLILCCNRQWGKSTVIAIKALHHALTHPNSSIVVVSRTEKQGGELINRLKAFANVASIPGRRVPGYDFSFLLENGSKIVAIAHSTETGPCRTADVLIYDEAAIVKDAVFSVTLPFIAYTGGAVWMMSTPRAQLGFFYNFWHDNDPQWTRVFSTVDDCPEISQAFLDLHRKGAPDDFRREFYCEFTQPAGRLTTRERVRACYNPALSARKLPSLKL